MAVNDPPRVHLPGQVFLRNASVAWPNIEELEVSFTHPLVMDEDALLDVPSVSVSGGCAVLHAWQQGSNGSSAEALQPPQWVEFRIKVPCNASVSTLTRRES